MVELRLLGEFIAVTDTGGPLHLPTRKAVALLAYLALNHGRAYRADLARLLWADVPETQARQSLRQAAWQIRTTFAPTAVNILTGDRDELRLNAREVRVDVQLFERLVGSGAADDLRRACGLYRGDVLSDLRVSERQFRLWLAVERMRLKQLAIEAHEAHLQQLINNGRMTEAIAIATRMLVLDPLVEWPYRALMMLYAQIGDFEKAVNQFHVCVNLLRKEIGCEPAVQTVEVFEEVRRCARLTERRGIDVAAADPRRARNSA